jgi:phosphohistidine phosphatase
MGTRRLIIMRHATAGGGGGHSDHARRLTPEGNDLAWRVGLRLGELGVEPDLTLCSSASRCRETWEAVSRGLGPTPPRAAVEFSDALYNAGPAGLRHALAGVVDAETVLLIAHNPGVSMFAIGLDGDTHDDRLEDRHGDPRGGPHGGDTRLRSGFTPATIALFDVASEWPALSSTTAQLVLFERPMHT